MTISMASWEVGTVTSIDKNCATHKTKIGQWIICVAADSTLNVGDDDLGTFLIFDEEDDARTLASSLQSGAMPAVVRPYVFPAALGHAESIELASRSAMQNVTSTWRELTRRARPAGVPAIIGKHVRLPLEIKDPAGNLVFSIVEAEVCASSVSENVQLKGSAVFQSGSSSFDVTKPLKEMEELIKRVPSIVQ